MAGDSSGHGATAAVWVSVAIMIAGSIVGAIGLIEWLWPMFWVGVGLLVGGMIFAYFANIMDMVSEFSITASGEADPSSS